MKKMVALLIIIASLTVMWSLYGKHMDESRIATAVYGEYTDIINTDALMIKNEHAVSVSGDGYFQNNLSPGSKVHKGENLGVFYSGTPDSELVARLNAVNEQLREISVSSSSEDLFANDIASINDKITEYTKQMSVLSASGNQREINVIKNEIETLLSRKKNIEEGTAQGKNTLLDSLTAEKNSLVSKLGKSSSYVFAPSSGIFSDTADGLESSLSVKDIEKYTVSDIEQYLSDADSDKKPDINPHPICKVVDNSEWVTAFVCDSETADRLLKQKTTKLKINGASSDPAECRIVLVSKETDGKKVVFAKGNSEIYQLLSNRKVSFEVYVDTYSGLKVPVSAVKGAAGKNYVLVKKGRLTEKKDVEVLYKNDSIAIINEDNTKENNLLLYDEVVINDDSTAD